MNVPSVKHHTDTGNWVACVIDNPVADFSPRLHKEVLWFCLRTDLDMAMLGSVTFALNGHDIFAELDGLKRKRPWVSVCTVGWPLALRIDR